MAEGFERVAFADVLREVALAIDPYVHLKADTARYNTHARLSDVISLLGWDFAKNNFDDVRRLLQRIGTEAGRQILGENIWVETAFKNARSDKIVVTDVRFLNEADAIRSRGGLLIRIHRPGVGPRNQHASEISLDDYPFDAHIDNDGTIEELHETLRRRLL